MGTPDTAQRTGASRNGWQKAVQHAAAVRRRIYRWSYQRCFPRRPTTPVFVVASQRSGTTFTMRVFEQSRDASVYTPQDRRAYDELGQLRGTAQVDRLLTESRATATVFKPMHEIQKVEEYLRVWPRLRVVWLVRHPHDCVNSATRKWNSMASTLRQMIADPRSGGWRSERLSDGQWKMLREHVHEGMSEETAQALFWYVRNSFFFEHGLDQSDRVAVFHYEDLVRQPIEQFGRMFSFCTLPFQSRFTAEVHASSIGRHATPSIAAEVEYDCLKLYGRFQPLGSAAPDPAGIPSPAR